MATKLPSGILVRDSSNNAIYFIDNGKKRHITTMEALAGGAFVDIDHSHLANVPDGKEITTKPSFDWKAQSEINKLLSDTGINWQQPAGYGSSSGGSSSGGSSSGGSSSGGSSSGEPRQQKGTIDQLYQKFFGRNSTNAEYDEYKYDSNRDRLYTDLSNIYKENAGIGYDGSPIRPGNNKTDNQLSNSSHGDTNNKPAGYYVLSDAAKKVYDNTNSQTTRNNLIMEAQSKYEQENKFNKNAPSWEEYISGNNNNNNNNNNNLSTTPLGEGGVNNLFQMYYGRDASLEELAYWKDKSDADLRPNLEANQQYSGNNTGNNNTGEVSTTDRKWIDEMYQKYFDRPASDPEAANWAKSTPAALSQFLEEEAKKYNYTSEYFKGEEGKRIDSAFAIIDNAVSNGTIPQDVAELWKSVVKNYPPGVEYSATEILDAFQKTKDETIDPYFKELADIAMKDYQTAYQTLEGSRNREIEAQNAKAGDTIRQAKAGLEKSGMTFTGKAVEDLGAESAYSQDSSNGNVPEQIPFGGMFYEGKIPQSNRLIASSTAARYKDAMQQLGRSAENLLGTDKAGSLGIPYESAGVNLTGELGERKSGKEAVTLQALINQYKEKQRALTNIN